VQDKGGNCGDFIAKGTNENAMQQMGAKANESAAVNAHVSSVLLFSIVFILTLYRIKRFN
jgi:hypothetical protein